MFEDNIFLKAVESSYQEKIRGDNKKYPFERMIINQLCVYVPFELIYGAALSEDLSKVVEDLSEYTDSPEEAIKFFQSIDKNHAIDNDKENNLLAEIQLNNIKYFKTYLSKMIDNNMIKSADQLTNKIQDFENYLVTADRLFIYTDKEVEKVNGIKAIDKVFETEMLEIKENSFIKEELTTKSNKM